MKRCIAVFAMAAILSASPTYAKKVQFIELPQAVQKAIIDQKMGNEKGMTIKEGTQDGKLVYHVTLDEPGKNVKLTLASDGAVLKDSRGASKQSAYNSSRRSDLPASEPGSQPSYGKSEKIGQDQSSKTGTAISEQSGAGKKSERNLTMSDLPKPVQDAITKEKGDTSTSGVKIDRKEKDGKVYYEVNFKKEGKDTEIHVDEQGTVLPDKD